MLVGAPAAANEENDNPDISEPAREVGGGDIELSVIGNDLEEPVLWKNLSVGGDNCEPRPGECRRHFFAGFKFDCVLIKHGT